MREWFLGMKEIRKQKKYLFFVCLPKGSCEEEEEEEKKKKR